MAENPYTYMLIGVMGIVILGHWFPSLKSIGSGETRSLKGLEDIQGIDLRALSMCRKRGLM